MRAAHLPWSSDQFIAVSWPVVIFPERERAGGQPNATYHSITYEVPQAKEKHELSKMLLNNVTLQNKKKW